jgi:hypothetical protein
MIIEIVDNNSNDIELKVIRLSYDKNEVELFQLNDTYCEMRINNTLVDFVKFVTLDDKRVAVFYQAAIKNYKYGTLKIVEFKSGDFKLIFTVNMTFWDSVEKKIGSNGRNHG